MFFNGLRLASSVVAFIEHFCLFSEKMREKLEWIEEKMIQVWIE